MPQKGNDILTRPCFLLCLALCGILLVLSRPASAKTIYGAESSDVASMREEDSVSADEGVIIDSLVIDNREIYDTSDPRFDNFLFKIANRLHIVTKAAVIRREMLISVGEPFSTLRAEETARNLRSQYRLVDAWIETERLPNDHLLVKVVTVDQWSLVGGPELSREGNRNRYKFGFEERNLLGYNQLLAFDWVVQEGDDNYIHTRFRDHRFFGKPFMLAAEHNTDPRAELTQLSVSRPFYSLDQNLSLSATLSRSGGRRDVYDDSVRVGFWHSRADQFDLITEWRTGSRYTKFSVGTWYVYHADRVDERSGEGIDFPNDSIYHLPALLLKGTHTDFLRVRRISNVSLLEDFSAITGVEILAGRAFNTDFRSHAYDVLDITGRVGQMVGSNLLIASHQQTYWLKSGRQLRSRGISSLRYFNNAFSFLTVAMRAQYRSDHYSSSVPPISLGGTSGLRGFDEFALSGDRAGTLNLETRWFPGVDILSTLIGGVVFADFGRTWKKDEPFSLRDMQYALGAGLRISLERATRSEIIRIDCSVRKDGTVQVAFSSGQYF